MEKKARYFSADDLYAKGFSPVDFWANVEKSSEEGCWWWKGKRYGNKYAEPHAAYGGYNVDGKTFLAHRISFTLCVGTIPKGKLCLHTCDRPLCVQPLHLFVGTHVDNVRDMDIKRRRGVRRGHRGEKNSLSKLTDAQVVSLRERYAAGDVTQKQLAEEYGVIRQTISTWVSGKRAGTTAISRPPREYATRGEGHYEGKLTTDAVRTFRSRAAAGHRLKDITDEHNATVTAPVTKQMVWRIIHRKAWTHVE